MLLAAVLFLGGCGSKTKNSGGNNNQQQQQNGGAGKGAPTEMTSACQNKVEGDNCEVATPGNSNSSEKMTGTCSKSPQGDQLVCRPSNVPNDTDKQPPMGDSSQAKRQQQ